MSKGWHWGPDWTEEGFEEKYGNLSLFTPGGQVAIPLGIDHYEVAVGGDGTPEGTISKGVRDLIVDALNAYESERER